MRDLPAGTVTFLLTDVEGSTKLLHELGAAEYAEALALGWRAGVSSKRAAGDGRAAASRAGSRDVGVEIGRTLSRWRNVDPAVARTLTMLASALAAASTSRPSPSSRFERP